MRAKPDPMFAVKVIHEDEVSCARYSPSSGKIEFDEPYGFLSKLLSVRKILENGDIVFAYIFDGDYLPRLFTLSKGSPIIIKDYVPIKGKETFIKIVISMASDKTAS